MHTSYNTIFVNGEAFNCFNSMSLYDLLVYLDFDTSRIVVEYNYKIISSDQFRNLLMNSNDRLEVITIVGGG